MNRLFRFALLISLTGLMLAINPAIGLAHENRQIADGKYNVEIGFLNEPAFVNQQNALFLVVQRIEHDEVATPEPGAADEDDHHAGSGAGVTNLENTLQAEVIYIDQSMPLVLSQTDEPGVYTSIFFPTAVGDYSFRIYGEIEGTAIDELFTSSPQGFDSVKDITPLQFPPVNGG